LRGIPHVALAGCFVPALPVIIITPLPPSQLLLIGSFAAVSTNIFAAPASPFSQPRVIFVSHLFASVAAVIFDYFANPIYPTAFLPQWLASSLCVATVICFMTWTGYIHPPAAACSLVYISGSQTIKQIGWMYIGMPTLSGVALFVALGVFLNNLAHVSLSRVEALTYDPTCLIGWHACSNDFDSYCETLLLQDRKYPLFW